MSEKRRRGGDKKRKQLVFSSSEQSPLPSTTFNVCILWHSSSIGTWNLDTNLRLASMLLARRHYPLCLLNARMASQCSVSILDSRQQQRLLYGLLSHLGIFSLLQPNSWGAAALSEVPSCHYVSCAQDIQGVSGCWRHANGAEPAASTLRTSSRPLFCANFGLGRPASSAATAALAASPSGAGGLRPLRSSRAARRRG